MKTTSICSIVGLAALTGWTGPALGQSDQERIERLEAQVDALADAVERGGTDDGGGKNVFIAGYGELHYNNLENDGTGDEKKEIDFHRFVLEFGYGFTDDIRFFSELEVEHALAGDGAPGEVELEQAYVEFDLGDRHRIKGGVFLIPVGILNETHEPPTFYGVERNQVEHDIVPATWWAGGALLSGNLGESGFSYDFGVHEGLSGADADIRSARQKSAEAVASDLAYTGRLRYTGIRGLELAATVQRQQDLSQDGASAGPAEEATLFETHAHWRSGPAEVRALYAGWDVGGNGLADAQETQDGYYLEGGYRFTEEVGVFARQSNVNFWDSGAEVDRDRTTIGVNYWPHPDVVVKFDVQQESADNDDDASDGFNLGIGYQF